MPKYLVHYYAATEVEVVADSENLAELEADELVLDDPPHWELDFIEEAE